MGCGVPCPYKETFRNTLDVHFIHSPCLPSDGLPTLWNLMFINQTTLPFLLLGATALLFVIVYIRAFFTNIGGTWYEQKEPGSPIQQIQLSQIGPWVWGKSTHTGGFSLYRGWFNGKTVTLRRKDFGAIYFQQLGFPDAVIPSLDGTEKAKSQFQFDAHQQKLVGQHFPQKIEISRTKPPRVTQRLYLPPTPRTWVRHPKQLNPTTTQ